MSDTESPIEHNEATNSASADTPPAEEYFEVQSSAEMYAAMTRTGSSKSASQKAAAVTTAAVKRQRSLADMFPKSAKPPAKKSKFSQEVTPAASALPAREVIIGKTPLNSIPFSLSEFRESLQDDEKELLQLECESLQLSWLKLLKPELRKPYFLELKRYLKKEGLTGTDQISKSVFPPMCAKDVYAWSKSPLGRVRVVIIGQDPYHNVGQAHGLCFSVPKGIATPPSLKNIYKEIQTEYPEFQIPTHGNLTSWAQNGVLLLNTCLTVRAHEANSHSDQGWEKFTEKIIEVVCMYGGANLNKTGVSKGVVFLAWGAPAAKRVAKVDKKKHLILTSAHPSPLSAHRGFLGNGHFKKANDWLIEKYGIEAAIDWCRLDA